MKVNTLALIFGILLLACLMITPAMAETITDNITADAVTSYSWVMTKQGDEASLALDRLRINNISYTDGSTALIRWDNVSPATFDAGAPAGTSTPFTAYLFSALGAPTTVIGTGYIGYQRRFNPPPLTTEILGYQYIVWTTYNVTGLTGDKMVELRYNHSLLYNATINAAGYGPIIWPPTGNMGFSNSNLTATGGLSRGDYTYNREVAFKNSYTATKPSGLKITGTVNKTPEGTAYNSRVFITTPLYSTIASETTASTTDFYFNVPYEQIRICIYDSTGAWRNSSILFNATTTVTPTPTPIAGGIYTLVTSTNFVNVSGTNTATIASVTDPSLADLKYIGAYWSNSTNAGDQGNFYETGSTVHTLSYTKIGGTWYGYDSTDVDYNNAKGGIPNPLTLKWDTTDGTKILHVTVQNTAGDYTYLTQTVTVGQGAQGLIQTRAQAMDGTNGGTLGMVSMQIYNHNTATWTNLSPNDGLGSVITPANTVLSFYAQKAGFTNGSLLNQPARGDLTYQIPLFIGPTAGAGFVNYFVTVKDAGGYPVGGAKITMTNPATGSSKLGTSSTTGGSQIFNLTATTLYTWSVEKTGYGLRSGSFTTPASGGSGNLDVVLSVAVTPTRTTPPMPTGSWTVNPSYTPSGNMTGFWTPWVNVFTQMGANSSELPLLIAAMLICFCMAAGFGMGGVLGGEVAMGFGAIFCVALGLIPIWVLLAIIILGFLFYGLKIGR